MSYQVKEQLSKELREISPLLSIGDISKYLNRDRRTIVRMLEGLKPEAASGRKKLYWYKDVARWLTMKAD